MGTVENLIAARALIDTPEKWKSGRHLVTPIMRAVREAGGINPEERALRNALPAGYSSLTSFEDEPTTIHAEVMALFGRAIDAEKAKEASNA